MIKSLILTVVLFAAHALHATTINSNILVSVRMQWSTNHTDWNECQPGSESSAMFVDQQGVSSSVFYSVLTNNNGIISGWQRLDVDTIWGASLNTATNHLLPVEFLVKPTTDAFTNISYRPILSITNFTPVQAPFDCHCPDDTNNYPPPQP